MSRVGDPFPEDLPDLLRLACGQGKMMLNVWFGSPRGYQVNHARSGNGWNIEYDQDCLEGICTVLRKQFGSMLERERANQAATRQEQAYAAELKRVTGAPCDLGVGCDEAGACYADAHGSPQECGRPSAAEADDDLADLIG